MSPQEGQAATAARLICAPVQGRIDRSRVISRVAGWRIPAVLECTQRGAANGWPTVLAFDPVAEFVIRAGETEHRLSAFRGALARTPRVPWSGAGRPGVSDALGAGAEPASVHGAAEAAGLPFPGGWIGFISYEFAARIEGVGSRHAAHPLLPEVHFHLYDTFALFDPSTQGWTAVAVDWPAEAFPDRASAHERLNTVVNLLAPVDTDPHDVRPATQPPNPDRANAAVRTFLDRPAYLARARRILEYIAAGDAYQVNLTRRFESAVNMTPQDLYLRLREVNPAPYSAFLPREGYAVLSASPELFLDVDDRRVLTRPIKGTRPRGADPLADAALQAELAASEKDRAELAMIVDLLRNDLGRVCEYGSIHVLSPGDIETHPTVHHRVAAIEGRLRADADLCDLLAATMPGGSVTGVPKIRAMQIINELEPCPRGIYCGAIGFISLDGRASFNLAIRTMLHLGDHVHLHAGGGIVADSDPDAEYEETVAKAAGMFKALGARADTDHAGLTDDPTGIPQPCAAALSEPLVT